MNTSDHKPSRVRFSFLSVMLAMTSVAGFYSAWSVYRGQEPLRERISELRLRLDGFEIVDRKLLHAVVLPNSAYGRWRWRIYVPDHTAATAVVMFDPPRKGDRQRPPRPVQLDPGFTTLELSIVHADRSDYLGDHWAYSLLTDEQRGATQAGPPPPWLANEGKKVGVRSMGRSRRRPWASSARLDPTTWTPETGFELVRFVRKDYEDG